MEVQIWFFAIALLIVAGVAYYLGYRACETKWLEHTQEQVNELIAKKIEEVGALYDETYKNVLAHLMEIAKKAEEKNNGQK